MVSGTNLVPLNTNIWDNPVSLVAKNEKDDLWMYEVTAQMVSMPENMLPLSERENSYLSGLVDLEIFQL